MNDRLRPQRPARQDDDEEDASLPIRGGWTEAQKQADAASPWAQAFRPDKATKVIKFLEDQPYASYRRHWVDRTGPNGPYKRTYTCLGTVEKPCPLCDAGNQVQAVSAFNIVELGDDGQLLLRTWDLGNRLLAVMKGYHADPKIGPLTKGYFGVIKTDSGKRGGTSQTNINPIKASQLEEDYGFTAPSAEELAAIKLMDSSIITIPTTAELREVAAEMLED